MENVSRYPKYTFANAQAIQEELSPSRIPTDKFIEKAYYAWKELPDKHSDYHVYIGTIDLNNNVELPENVEYIVNVSSAYYYYNNLLRDNIFLYYNGSRFVNNSSKEWEHYRLDKSQADRFSPNITYVLGDGYINFPQTDNGDFKGQEIAILYKGLLVDKNCDPLLYYREIQAIAARVGYYQLRYDLQLGLPIDGSLLPYLKQESDIAIARSGVPELFTDNELDSMLNVHASFNRKTYNNNYKFRS